MTKIFWAVIECGENFALVEKNRELERQPVAQEKLIAELKAKAAHSADDNLKTQFEAEDKIFLSNAKPAEGDRLNLVIADWACAEGVLQSWAGDCFDKLGDAKEAQRNWELAKNSPEFG